MENRLTENTVAQEMEPSGNAARFIQGDGLGFDA